jgi:hypothetical protein
MPTDGAAMRRFIDEHGAEVARLMRSRRTQTNEVGRCATILPALPPGPLALLEVGASAGLCLLIDQLQYEYGTTRVGKADAPLLLRCSTVDDVPIPVPSRLPHVTWRAGLDLEPIDVDDPEETDWLLACVWADHVERRNRLQAALRLVKLHRPAVERGDLVDDLPALLARVPATALLVVFHSAVLTYVDLERRSEFEALLAHHSRQRDIVWISNEGPGVIPQLEDLAPDRSDLRFRVGRTRFSSGKAHRELLAFAHGHGRDLEWLA